jgi:hypothetical protein
MLIVTTAEFGNPVIFFILVISSDRFLHGQPDSVTDTMQKLGVMRLWLPKKISRQSSLRRGSTIPNRTLILPIPGRGLHAGTVHLSAGSGSGYHRLFKGDGTLYKKV